MIDIIWRAPARPRRAVRRTLVASTIAAGLLVPALALPASATADTIATTPAAATTAPGATAPAQVTKAKKKKAKKKRSRVKVRRSDRIQTFKERRTAVKLHVRVRVQGKPAKGKVKVTSGKRKIAMLKLRKGKRVLRLPASLKPGKHKVKTKFQPASSKTRIDADKVVVRVLSRPEAIVRTAKKYAGVRYVPGGSTPRGFDCSGFTSYVYHEAVGRSLSHSSSVQRHQGHVVSRSQARAGDIIWTPGHVAIYLGGNKQIDAPHVGTSVQIRSIWQRSPTFLRVTT